MRLETALRSSAACLAIGIQASAWAQSATTPEAGAELGEVVVTAEKREESASKVGLSIAVLGGDDLAKRNVTNVDDLVRDVPGLTITPSSNGTPIFNLRGMAFNTPNLSSTSPVGVYVDQVAYAYPVMAAGPVFDVSRVEVLMGPQGTLYGRNTTGGLVNFITNSPLSNPAAQVMVEGGNYDTLDTRGFVTGPLSSTLSGRLAWDVEDSNRGWQESITRGDRLGKVRKEAVRGILAWKPNADFKAALTFNYWHNGSDTQAPQRAYNVLENTPFGVSPTALAPFLLTNGAKNSQADWTPSTVQPSPNTSSPRPPYHRDDNFGSVALNLEYSINDDLKLTALSSFNRYTQNDTFNDDGTAYEIGSDNQVGRINSYSQELRLSADEDRYHWMVGAYVSDDEIDERQRNYIGDFSTINLLRFVAATLNDPRYTATQVEEGFREADLLGKFSNRSVSGFVSGQYALTDTLKATLGARVTDDRSRFAGCAADPEGNMVPVWNTAVALLAGGYPAYNQQPEQCLTFQNNAPLPEGLFRSTLNEGNVSWRGNLDWSPVNNLLNYVSISRGYKSGNFPVIPANRAIQFEPARQEEVTSYELGSKFHYGIAQLSFAAYYNDYRNKQVFGAIEDPIFSALARIVNVPKSETYGNELSLELRPADGLTVASGVSYIRSKVISYVGYDAFGNLLNFAGAEFPNTPRVQLSEAIDYEKWVTDKYKVGLDLNASYQSDSHGDFANSASYSVFPAFGSPTRTTLDAPIYHIPAYGIVNGALSFDNTRQGWQLKVWAHNLFDRNYYTSAAYFGDSLIRFAGMPRTFGLTLTMNFE